MLEKYKIGKQPCHNFKPVYTELTLSFQRDCPHCKKINSVAFCLGCSKDHHVDGVDTCEYKKNEPN